MRDPDVSHEQLFEKMANCNIRGEAEEATKLAIHSLDLGIKPLHSIDNGFVKGIRDDVIDMVGGAPTSAGWAKEIKADGYGENATEAVCVAEEVMQKKRSSGKSAETRAPVGTTSQSAHSESGPGVVA